MNSDGEEGSDFSGKIPRLSAGKLHVRLSSCGEHGLSCCSVQIHFIDNSQMVSPTRLALGEQKTKWKNNR